MPERVGRALDAPVIPLQAGRLQQFGETVGHRCNSLALLARKHRIGVNGFPAHAALEQHPQGIKPRDRCLLRDRLAALALASHLQSDVALIHGLAPPCPIPQHVAPREIVHLSGPETGERTDHHVGVQQGAIPPGMVVQPLDAPAPLVTGLHHGSAAVHDGVHQPTEAHLLQTSELVGLEAGSPIVRRASGLDGDLRRRLQVALP